jgi:sugar lactone lactonase YvrE
MTIPAKQRLLSSIAARTALIAATVIGPPLSVPAVAADGGFHNGQNAALVLGQRDFLSNTPAVTQRGESGPSAVGFDGAGNLWISDQCGSRMLEFLPPFRDDMKASVVIGEPDFRTTSSPQPCFALSTAILPTNKPNVFSYNDKFTFDVSGDLWLADAGNNRVLMFMPPFTSGMNPSLVIGQPDFTSSGTATTSNGLNFPTQPLFDPSGNLWVADIGNNRVLEYLAPFSNGMSASLVIGQQDFGTRDCVTSQNGFCQPDSIVFDLAGNLWVTDAFGNNRVVKFRPPFSTGMNASDVIGQTDFTSSSPGLGRTGLNFSDGSGIGIDADGNLWVGDSGNNRVLEFPNVEGTIAKRAIRVIGQNGFETNTVATTRNGLWIPVQPAFDPLGDLWVPDGNNFRVLEFKKRN